jgi:hypothetical protein
MYERKVNTRRGSKVERREGGWEIYEKRRGGNTPFPKNPVAWRTLLGRRFYTSETAEDVEPVYLRSLTAWVRMPTQWD